MSGCGPGIISINSSGCWIRTANKIAIIWNKSTCCSLQSDNNRKIASRLFGIAQVTTSFSSYTKGQQYPIISSWSSYSTKVHHGHYHNKHQHDDDHQASSLIRKRRHVGGQKSWWNVGRSSSRSKCPVVAQCWARSLITPRIISNNPSSNVIRAMATIYELQKKEDLVSISKRGGLACMTSSEKQRTVETKGCNSGVQRQFVFVEPVCIGKISVILRSWRYDMAILVQLKHEFLSMVSSIWRFQYLRLFTNFNLWVGSAW
jgi:hypothetical protein